MTAAQEDQVKTLLAEQENLIRQQITEIEALREKARDAENTEDRHATGGAVCPGCYQWRKFFAALFGLVCGVSAIGILRLHQAMLRGISLQLLGREDGVPALLIGFGLLTAAAPVLATVAEWRWLKFKNGDPGTLRSIAEAWRAMKDAFERGTK